MNKQRENEIERHNHTIKFAGAEKTEARIQSEKQTDLPPFLDQSSGKLALSPISLQIEDLTKHCQKASDFPEKISQTAKNFPIQKETCSELQIRETSRRH